MKHGLKVTGIHWVPESCALDILNLKHMAECLKN